MASDTELVKSRLTVFRRFVSYTAILLALIPFL